MTKFLDGIIKCSSWLVLLCLVGCAVSWFMKGRLPPPKELDHKLRQAPKQASTKRKPFDFKYRGTTYNVTPVAEYEIWGLVVSHNNINSMADIYHDKDSVDIKDLALIWGSNVLGNDYRRVTYSSNSYIVEFRYPAGVNFNHSEISNNHLLSADPKIRKTIAEVHVGDQIYLKGMLVNYTSPKMRGHYRNSSLTRDDTAMGACEVIFVEDVRLMKRGQPFWFFVYRTTFYGGIIGFACLILTFFLRFSVEQRELDRKREEE